MRIRIYRKRRSIPQALMRAAIWLVVVLALMLSCKAALAESAGPGPDAPRSAFGCERLYAPTEDGCKRIYRFDFPGRSEILLPEGVDKSYVAALAYRNWISDAGDPCECVYKYRLKA
jgi:hypothetical protein